MVSTSAAADRLQAWCLTANEAMLCVDMCEIWVCSSSGAQPGAVCWKVGRPWEVQYHGGFSCHGAGCAADVQHHWLVQRCTSTRPLLGGSPLWRCLCLAVPAAAAPSRLHGWLLAAAVQRLQCTGAIRARPRALHSRGALPTQQLMLLHVLVQSMQPSTNPDSSAVLMSQLCRRQLCVGTRCTCTAARRPRWLQQQMTQCTG